MAEIFGVYPFSEKRADRSRGNKKRPLKGLFLSLNVNTG